MVNLQQMLSPGAFRVALWAVLATWLSSFAQVNAIAPLTIKGNKFFDSQTGLQFYIKGVAYQLQARVDPLVNKAQCELDASLMKELGVNTIRVYQVDPTANHDDCMSVFADNGIYLFVDLANYETGINEDNPYWSQDQLSSFAATLDAFAGYDNTVGFWIGNEVVTKAAGAKAVEYVAAAVADIKTHIQNKGFSHPVYIGYASTDNADTRPMVQNYLACEHEGFSNRDASIDFYGVNAYEWCNPTDTFETSGYSRLTGYLSSANYDIPAFFSEDGCNTAPPRLFEDMFSIYGSNMTDWWSGSIVYEWINEANKYGLVSYGMVSDPSTAVGGDPYERSGTPTPVSPDFANLQTVWASVSPTTVTMSLYTPTNTQVACPSSAGAWTVNPSESLPTLGDIATSISATGSSPSRSNSAAVTLSTTSSSSPSSNSEVTIATSTSTSTSRPNSASSLEFSGANMVIVLVVSLLLGVY
ncbi:hypothetical protein ABW19_dt0210443 [Dactylella cylindrospora]|nr:hypothetical protein ABW19_dt0210443 [Dactylella cylindrospora]